MNPEAAGGRLDRLPENIDACPGRGVDGVDGHNTVHRGRIDCGITGNGAACRAVEDRLGDRSRLPRSSIARAQLPGDPRSGSPQQEAAQQKERRPDPAVRPGQGTFGMLSGGHGRDGDRDLLRRGLQQLFPLHKFLIVHRDSSFAFSERTHRSFQLSGYARCMRTL